MTKDSQLRDYLEVCSLSSDQIFLRVQLKTFQRSVDGLLIYLFFAFGFYYSLFHILIIKSSYRAD